MGRGWRVVMAEMRTARGVDVATVTAATFTTNFTVGGTENLEFMPIASTLIESSIPSC